MAKKIPYLHGNGTPVEVINDPKNPQIYFDPNDPASLSFTNQSDAEGTDVNKMFAKYQKTGLLTDLITGDQRKPFYGDFTEIPDFRTLKTRLTYAQQAFDLLPANVRDRFQNDPQNLINFLQDAKNDEEAISLGLKDKPKAAEAAANSDAGTASDQPAKPVAKPGAPAEKVGS